MASDLGKGKATDRRKRCLSEIRTQLTVGYRCRITDKASCENPWIAWIAIHGNDSVCAVSSSIYMDKDGLCNFLSKVLTTEIVNPLSGQSLQAFKGSADRAAVVSVACNVLEDDCDNEALSVRLGEQMAINFLAKEFYKCPAFSYEESIRIAISALSYLLRSDLMAHEIEVVSIKDIGSVLPLPLPLPLSEEKIEEVLASICRDPPKIKMPRHRQYGRKYKNKGKGPRA